MSQASDVPQPPIADRRPSVRSHHGDEFIDDYEWLRVKDDPSTIAYLTAENEYAEAMTLEQEPLRERIFEEIKARVQETDLSVPVRHGEWWYYTRTREGSQYGISCRCPIGAADDWEPPVIGDEPTEGEVVVFDSNLEAAGHEFFSVGGFTVSDDGNLLAYSVDTRGDERYTIRFRDLRGQREFSDEIADTSGSVTWAGDATHVFYTTVDDAWRPHRVWRHRIGTPVTDDVMVFDEPDERFFVGIGRTQSDRYLMIGASSKITSEVRFLEVSDPEGEFTLAIPRSEGIEYSLDHAIIGGEDFFLVLHNDGFADFQVNAITVEDVQSGAIDRANSGNVLIAGRDGVRLDDVDVFASAIVLSYRRDALARISYARIGPDGGLDALSEWTDVEFGEELFASGVGGTAEWDPPMVRVGFGSFVTPGTVFDLRLDDGTLILRKQAIVRGGYDPDEYVQERTWARAGDGTLVPVSIVARRDTPRDGSAPCLLYAYGSYEASMDPGMSVIRLSLLDRGFVYAVAHVRGGGELGRGWYEQGRLLHKKNTFTDFVAAAHHLVAQEWTSHERLIAEGGSAGGLLMGAVANLAPEAFCGIVASVPFVDALTSILDPNLPLTVTEWDEWGDPLHDPEVYAYMKSYSPYENVTAQDYPAILALTSLNDTRVLYVEPAKWVARLRAVGTGTRPVLLKTEMNAGHGGVTGRYASWRERAWEVAWIITTAGAEQIGMHS